MLFNSLEFLIFFPVVTTLYFVLPHRFRWLMLLIASCVFYMFFIPAYIAILGVTIVIDYIAGMVIADSSGPRRRLTLIISIISTCAVLFIFKYFNFVNGNLGALASLVGWNYPIGVLEIILPIGLSFHTFQSLSYVIEVYRGQQQPERHFGIYSLYVMFYPQLVAGPIERPQNLLHQFHEEHRFDYHRVTDGLKLMIWGLFKKVVIADRLADYVNQAYAIPAGTEPVTLIVATVLFAFQIFCDFSGYSDIAIGAAQVMGFQLMRNFNRPYFARSISEFWTRWHISLSTWFRDYVFLSVAYGTSRKLSRKRYLGIRADKVAYIVAVAVTFTVTGLWHGANWTFVVWGGLHGLYLIVSVLTKTLRGRVTKAVGLKSRPRLHAVLAVVSVFVLVDLSYVFFRADSLDSAVLILSRMAGALPQLLDVPGVLATVLSRITPPELAIAVLAIIAMETIHLLQNGDRIRVRLARQPLWVRWSLYYGVLMVIILFGVFNKTQFIYFQF